MSDPAEWYRSLPPFTKGYFTASVATTLLSTLGVISPYYLYLDFDLVIGKFQLWRLLANFLFFGKFSMPFVFAIVLLVRYFGMLENEHFSNGSAGLANLLVMVIFSLPFFWLASHYLGIYFLGNSLVFMAMYVWSRRDPYRQVVFYGFSFMAWHTPFLFMLLGVLFGNNPIPDLVGIVIGHLYHFVVDIAPRNYNKTFLSTPKFFYELIDHYHTVFTVNHNAGVGGAAPARPVPNWQRGQGYRLNE